MALHTASGGTGANGARIEASTRQARAGRGSVPPAGPQLSVQSFERPPVPSGQTRIRRSVRAPAAAVTGSASATAAASTRTERITTRYALLTRARCSFAVACANRVLDAVERLRLD